MKSLIPYSPKQYNGFCVPECPRDTYLNVHRGICEPCHAHCHPRDASRQTICTGPKSNPGPGGCNKCEKFLFLSDSEEIGETRKNSGNTMLLITTVIFVASETFDSVISDF